MILKFLQRFKKCPPYWFHCKHKRADTNAPQLVGSCLVPRSGKVFQWVTCCRCPLRYKESL